ncbi:MAG: TonB-dependent receptor [Sphingobium sp.]
MKDDIKSRSIASGVSLIVLAMAGMLPQVASAQQGAVSAQEDDSGVADIVVEARKRAERLQDVPIAVTALSGEALTAQSVQSFRDIQAQTPSLSITPVSGDRNATAVSLRGQTQTDVLLTVDPAVGIYLDGVNISKTLSTEMSNLIDVDRIEVLKGPQGTLFGRNTTGGAINLFYKQPTDKFEGKVTLRTDEYFRRGGSAILNVPIASNLALRVVGQYDKRDGYGRNRFNGQQVGGDLDGGSARAALRWNATDDVEVVLRGDYNKSNTSTLPWQFAGIRSPSSLLTVTGPQGATLAGLLNQNVDPRDINHNFGSQSRVQSYGGSGTVSIRLSDSIDFKSITAYRVLDRFTKHDLDASPYNLIHVMQPTHQEVFTQEAQLSGVSLDERFNWIVGAFYSRETGTDGTRTINYNTTTNVDGLTTNVTDGYVVNSSIAGFAQATFKVTEEFSLTGGLRYTKDNKLLDSRNRIDRPLGTYVSCNLPVTFTGVAPTQAACLAHLTQGYENVSYMATADYKPRDGFLAYLRTARGYKAGGFNLRGGAFPQTFQPFQPETVTDYEIGLKTDWFDRKLRVNLAAYLSKYNGIQRTIIVPSGQVSPPTLTVVQNAAKGTIKGAEAEVTAVPVPGLTLRGTLGYVDAKYDQYVSNSVDRTFEKFPYQPAWNWALSAAYVQKMESGPMRFQVDYAYKSSQDGAPSSLTDATTKDWTTIRGYGLLNGRVSKAFDAENVEVAVFVKNALNKTYRTTILDFSGSLGYVLYSLGDPRIIGAEVSIGF